MPVMAKCQTCDTLVPVSELEECDCGCGLVCWDADACDRRWDEADAVGRTEAKVAAEAPGSGEVA